MFLLCLKLLRAQIKISTTHCGHAEEAHIEAHTPGLSGPGRIVQTHVAVHAHCFTYIITVLLQLLNQIIVRVEKNCDLGDFDRAGLSISETAEDRYISWMGCKLCVGAQHEARRV